MQFFRSIVIVLLCVAGLTSLAQNSDDCEQVLNSATDEFNSGRFYGIAQLLNPCLEKGFSREQRQRANLLLTQVYLLLDDPDNAERSYLNVLRANPEFESDMARDPIDVVYLSKKFTAFPIFSISGRIGANTSIARVIQTIDPGGEASTVNNYSLRAGWHVGFGVDWNITKEVALVSELNYVLTSYGKRQVKFNGDEEDFTDRQNWVSLPFSLKYADTQGRIRPYGYIGVTLHWLVSDKAQINLLKKDIINNQLTAIPAESPTLTFTEYRNKFNQSLFIGGGVRYKIGLDYVFADLRYSAGLRNVVKPTSTYAGDGPMVEWAHTDDYFRLDNIAISFGYVKPLYKPRKVKKVRTMPILRGLNKRAE
jgi:hypothetical protein